MAKKSKTVVTRTLGSKTPGGDAAPPDPSVKSAAYVFMETKWSMINTLLGGTALMRAAGQQYLPQHAEESQTNYNERLNRCTLFNMLELTLDSLVGKPFVEPIKMNRDVPKSIVEISKDVDLQGNDITSFAREWLRDAIAKGFSHALIDMPALDPEERQVRTLQDDLEDQRRPYWALVRPEQIIFAYAEMIKGVETLVHVRIRETETKLVGFEEVEVQHIRILRPGGWELWELQQEDDKKDPIWVKIGEGASDLPYIPLVTFYANRCGFMVSKPPLEDLAYLNIRHWQSTSDQINVLTVARFPMLACSGAQLNQGTEDNVAIGPRQLLSTRDANGKFYYVEHTGKSIEAGRVDLQDIEDRMAAYGAEFLRRRIGGRTATERALDSSEAISPLRDIVNRFMVAVNRALQYTADWIDEDKGGTVIINTDFTEEDMNTASVNTLADARRRGDISRRTWLTEMKRWEVLAPDLDVDAEMKQIIEEAKTLPLKPTSITATETFRTNIEDKSGGPNATDLANATSGPDNPQIPEGMTEPGNKSGQGLPDKTQKSPPPKK
jgi:hypothetical protein